MLLGEGHVGQHVGLRVVHDGGELGDLRADLVGDRAPLHARGFRRLLGEGGGNEGRHDPPPALAGMGEHVAHEVDAATLPGGAEHLGDGGLDAFMGIGDDELDATQPPARQLAQELRPDRLGLLPTSMPSTSRLPSPLTPMAMMTADTMRPPRRTFR